MKTAKAVARVAVRKSAPKKPVYKPPAKKPPVYKPPPKVPNMAADHPLVGTPKASSPGSLYGHYTLDMDPEVIAAKAAEKEGLGDLESSPMPDMPDLSSYNMQLANAQEDRTIGIGRLDYQYGLNKGNLEHSNFLAGRGIINNLAARGMLRSGETPGLQAEQARNFMQAMTDLGVKDTWARQDLDRGVARASAAISAARSAANASYANAMADRARGIAISKRDLHKGVTTAYVNAARYVMEHPELFMGEGGTFNPADWLGQIPQ